MDINKYTSLELSKKIAEGMKQLNIELESEKEWVCVEKTQLCSVRKMPPIIIDKKQSRPYYNIDCNPDNEESKLYEDYYLAYDILNDICVKHAKEFFGEGTVNTIWRRRHAEKIIIMLQQNKPLSEVEDYIWENCLFNKKNT